VQAFANAAIRHGADIRTGVEVLSITTTGGRVTGVTTTAGEIGADTVIVAAGIYSPKLLGPLGYDLPLNIAHVPAVQTVPAPPILEQVLGVADGTFAGRQQVDGRFRLTVGSTPWAASDIHNDYHVQPTMTQVQATLAYAIRAIPALQDLRIAQVWGGLLDLTPDALPVLQRPSGIDGLVIGAGFSGHGFCLGPVTGQILADLAVHGSTELPIDAFQIERFAEKRDSAESLTLHG
jgi:sarcosine oxidase subunit beta